MYSKKLKTDNKKYICTNISTVLNVDLNVKQRFRFRDCDLRYFKLTEKFTFDYLLKQYIWTSYQNKFTITV